MKIEKKINKISSTVLSKVKSTFLSTIEFEKNIGRYITKRFGRDFHNGLYGSLPGFAVTLCVLGNFLHFCCLLTFLQTNFFSKKLFQEYYRGVKWCDPDQDQHSFGPDLGPNSLQRLSANDKKTLLQRKELSYLCKIPVFRFTVGVHG